jgi:pantoate kinase
MPVRSEIVIEVTTDMDEELARLKREQRVERAMNIYLSTPRGQGLGHSALMALGRRLSNAGLNFGEVRYQMEEAIRARPHENPKAVIKTLIRTPSLRAG